MKHIKARKLKNCWIVEIVRTLSIHTKDDVKTVIRQEGLKIQQPYTEDDNSIYAK